MDTDGDVDNGDFEEFNEDDASGTDMQKLYRMMAQLARQQKVMAQSLKDTRQGSAGDAEPRPREKPPRPSPPKPRKETNWDQSVPCSIPAGRQPRLARRTLILGIVRKAVAELIGHVDKKKPLPPSPPTNVLFPTLQSFYIRWEETEKSLFNRLAIGIAVDYIRGNWADENFTEDEIVDLTPMVAEHIRYLCRTVKQANQPDAKQRKKANLKRASASSRRKTIYESRLKVIDHFPNALGRHRNLIVQLGIDGTSSDEEDPGRKNVYLVRRREELSSKVQILKSQLDLAYALFFKGTGTQGSQLHTRELSEKISSRRYTAQGLPTSCLSRRWFKSLTVPEREFYGFSDYEYDFSFPRDLLRRKVGRMPDDIPMSEDEAWGDDESEEL
ncbi:hypothetical protein FRC08_007744 [Ceratobasidium sp. 394]|nr:hypothetical protein FRC08_007744 [Ceratobasidium sp. 394]